MKKLYIWMMAFTLSAILCMSADPIARAGWRTYDDGYEEGHREGYDEGYSAGYGYGFDDGWYEGYLEGYRVRREHEQVYSEYAFATDLMELVNNHCEDPIEYIGDYYSYHWGDFTKAYGDICFGKIPPEMQSLINYPRLIPDVVWTVKTGSSYHSVWYCYTLLRTDDSNLERQSQGDAVIAGYSPCSKCVAPDAGR